MFRLNVLPRKFAQKVGRVVAEKKIKELCMKDNKVRFTKEKSTM